MRINFITKGPILAPFATLETAAAVEATIVNHCLANLPNSFNDPGRNQQLRHVMNHAQERYDILMEILR